MLAAAALACGCGEKAPGMTPEELVSILRTAGVQYDVCESIALSSIGAPGLRMLGDSLEVEIYQVNDPEKLAEAALVARQVSAAQASATHGYAIQSHVRGDLLIIVRAEPERRMIVEALPPPEE
jgi:hypothetical protein